MANAPRFWSTWSMSLGGIKLYQCDTYFYPSAFATRIMQIKNNKRDDKWWFHENKCKSGFGASLEHLEHFPLRDVISNNCRSCRARQFARIRSQLLQNSSPQNPVLEHLEHTRLTQLLIHIIYFYKGYIMLQYFWSNIVFIIVDISDLLLLSYV